MAELEVLGMASRGQKAFQTFHIGCQGSQKCREPSTPTAPSPFITINNEEVIYISPNADTDTVELIIKGKNVHMVTPNNFGFGGREMRSKESRKEEGKDRKEHCQHRE